jgi:hypothetical protein
VLVQFPYDAYDAHDVHVTESYAGQVYSGPDRFSFLSDRLDDILNLFVIDGLSRDVPVSVNRDVVAMQG